MLSNIALKAVSLTLSFGCFLKLFPYKWDSTLHQLSLPTNRTHIWIFNCHRFYMLVLGIICAIRFILFVKVKDVPAAVRVLHMVWSLGYLLTLICFLQFHLKKTQIMHFGNLLFKYTLEARKEIKMNSSWQLKPKDTLSVYVITSTILLFVNPPCHAVAVIHMPCSPNFVSSLYFACSSIEENESTFVEKIPWIFAENMVIANFLFAWSFSWIMIYLGLAWIREELRKLSVKVKVCGFMTKLNPKLVSGKFMELQCVMSMVNDAFQLYLAWFPSILLGLVALMMYGTIRLWHIKLLTYLNFPVCGFRCLFESMTPLAISGQVNQESSELLREWKCGTTTEKSKWLVLFRKSCTNIKCTAGSFYAFENSIVVTTVHNCAQLTLNLLLVYK